MENIFGLWIEMDALQKKYYFIFVIYSTKSFITSFNKNIIREGISILLHSNRKGQKIIIAQKVIITIKIKKSVIKYAG